MGDDRKTPAMRLGLAKGPIAPEDLVYFTPEEPARCRARRAKRADIPRAGDQIIEALSRGEGVIVFPEGTSTRGDEVLPFNSSFLEFAARTDTPVSYVSLSYRTPEGEPPPSECVTWWDDTPFLPHLLRMLEVKRFTAVLNFGDEPIINPDRKRLAAELRQKVQESFIPVI